MKIILFFILVMNINIFAQDYFYFDNGVRKNLKLSTEYFARAPDESSTSSARSTDSGTGAVILSNQKLEILRRTTSGTTTRDTRNTTTTNTSEVPVLEAENGEILAIPGGILVVFKSSFSDAQVNSFISSKSFVVEKTFFLKNKKYYLIKSPASLETIELSQALSSDAIVEEARPNFWIDIKSRDKAVHFEKIDHKKR